MKFLKYSTTNTAEEENEMKHRKLEDWEEKTETCSTKPSDTNADVTNRIFKVGSSIIKHTTGYELSQTVVNSKV